MSAPATPQPLPRIRLATAADIDAMVPVINAAFEVENFIEGTRTDTQRMLELMQKGQFLLAEPDGGPSGRVLACVYVEIRRDRAYFGLLAVDPARQGMGLGRVMVEAAENYCRQFRCRWMDITVLSQRSELLPFYRKLGYVEARTEAFRPPRPLKHGIECHSIVMSKQL